MEGQKLASTFVSVSCRTLFIILVILLLYFIGKKVYGFGYDVFDEHGMNEKGYGNEITVVIPENSTVKDVGTILYNNGLIRDVNVFYAQTKIFKYSDKIVAGTYTLKTDMSPTEILTVISPPMETETEG